MSDRLVFSATNTLILTSVFGGIAIYKILRKVHMMIRQTRAQPAAKSVEDPPGSPPYFTETSQPSHYTETSQPSHFTQTSQSSHFMETSLSHFTETQGDIYEKVDECMGRAKGGVMAKEGEIVIELEQNQAYGSTTVATTKTV